jgi:hypothetical protein
MRGSLHCATDDEAVHGSGRDDAVVAGDGKDSCKSKNNCNGRYGWETILGREAGFSAALLTEA